MNIACRRALQWCALVCRLVQHFACVRMTVIAISAALLLWLPLPLCASSQTTTALAVTASGTPVNSITSGTVITLTATVLAGSAPVTLGTINFCDATALSCSDIHLLGTAQLTATGTAVTRFRPPVGAHSYKAVFTGTKSYTASSSAASSLVVPGTTKTTLAVTGGAGNYTLTGSVAASGAAAPTAPLSFQDITNGNYVLAAPSLGRSAASPSLTNSAAAAIGTDSYKARLLAIADFNLDGIPDIIVPDGYSGVDVLLGKGDGSFAAAETVITGSYLSTPIAAIAGDFNADGKPDVAVVIQASNNLTILLGNGDGTFTTSSSTPSTGRSPSDIATGDLNGDGRLDLAVTNTNDNTITILLGKGDGTFTSATTVVTSMAPVGIVAADFDGDGNLDLASTYSYYSSGCVSVFHGNGDGSFVSTPGLAPYEPTSCYVAAAADVNQDGHIDLVVADYDNYRVYAYMGTGDGTFPITKTSAQSDNHYSPVGLTVGDFNGDGIIDYAAVSIMAGAISLGTGNGDGTFTLKNDSALAGNPNSFIAAADLTGDGTSDIVSETGTGALGTFLSSASQTFQATLTNLSPAGSDTHQLQAVYPGDAAYSASTSAAVSLTAQPVTTLLSLTVSPPIGNNYSQQIVLSASLLPYTAQGHSTDGETITFYSGATAVGTATLTSGYASLNVASLPAGANSLKAVYDGDTNLAGSTSPIVPYSVTYATALSLAVNPAIASYGQHVTLTATLVFNGQSSATNGESVTFKNGSSTLGTAILSSGVATFNLPTLPVSTANLSAYYGGDASVAAVTSNNVVFPINKAAPTLTWTPFASSIVYSGTYVGSALFNASSTTGGTIAYTATAAGGSPVPISAYTVLNAGSYILTATLIPADSADYTSASVTYSFTVTPAPLTVVPQNATRTYGMANAVFSGAVTGALRGDTFTVTGSTTATTASAVGSYPITYSITGTDLANYSITQATGTLTITPANPNLLWSSPTSISYGTALSAAQLNATSPTPGSFVYTPALGTILPAGLQTLSVTFTPTDTVDYGTQKLTVPLLLSKAMLTITANNFARVFGTANPSFTGTLSGAVNGDTFTESFTSAAALTSIVGSYPIVPSVAGANLANYTIRSTNGSLTVSQAGTATSLLLSNANLTLSATISPLNTGDPTGTVSFYEGQTLVGTGTVINGGASYTTSTFPAGDVAVTAAYSGDANFTQSASPPVLVLTVQPAQTQIVVATAGSASDTLTLSAAPGFSGSVQFSCTGLPQYATCSFSPSSVTFGTAATATTTVTIQTGVMASLGQPARMGSQRGIALAALCCLPGFGLAAFTRRRLPRPLFTALIALFAITLCTSLTACGTAPQAGSSGATLTKSQTGSYNVEITSAGSGGLSQTTSLALSVQ